MSTKLCAVLAGLIVALIWLPPMVSLEYTPDSADYDAIATNLALGNGYREHDGNVATNRSPVYSVLLSVFYDAQTFIWQQRIIWFHRCLAFSIGATLVLYAASHFGRLGMVCGLITAVLVGFDDELQYAAVQVLTELPATALLMICVVATNWANQGSARREYLTAICHVLLFMTRSALIFCGLGYGICLILNAIRYRQIGAWERTLIFGGICTVAVVAWSLYLWFATGQVVLLTTTGLSNMAAGLDPACVAESHGLPIPRTDAELEAFWTAAPPLQNSAAGTDCMMNAIKSPRQVLKMMIPKFKIAFLRTPNGVYFLGIFGLVLQGLGCTQREKWSVYSSQRWQDALMYGLAQAAYIAAFVVCTIGVCGLSHPVLKAAIVVCTLAIACTRVMPLARFRRSRHPNGALGQSMAIVVFGFVMMTFLAFGLPRFTRPFLPSLYLSAVMCVPLAFRLLMTSEQFRTTPIPPHSSTAV